MRLYSRRTHGDDQNARILKALAIRPKVMMYFPARGDMPVQSRQYTDKLHY